MNVWARWNAACFGAELVEMATRLSGERLEARCVAIPPISLLHAGGPSIVKNTAAAENTCVTKCKGFFS